MVFCFRKIDLLLIALVFTVSYGSQADLLKVYRKILPSRPLSLSPQRLEDQYSVHLMRQTNFGLVTLGNDSRILGGLAKSWVLSRDKRKYTFVLRDDLKYSDGAPIRTVDVIHTFENLLSAESLFSAEFAVIKGAAEYTKGLAKKISGIRISGINTIEIEIVKPYPPFMALLTSPQAGVLSREAIYKINSGKLLNIPSAGPYFINEVTEKNILLKKNPYFWNKSSVYFDSIWYDVGIGRDEAIRGILTKKYDDIYPYSVPEDAAEKNGFQKISTFSAFSWYIIFNLKRPHLNKLSFRQLLLDHFDYEAFLQNVKMPAHLRAQGMIPMGCLGHTSKARVKSRGEIKISEMELGCTVSSPCSVNILNPYPELQNALELGFERLNKKFKAIKVEISQVERQKWYSQFSAGDYQATMVGNNLIYPDTFFLLKYLIDPRYHPGLNTKKISRLLEKSLLTDSHEERSGLFSEIDDELLNQVGILPLYFGDMPHRYVSSRLAPFQVSILGFPSLNIMHLREKK